MVSFDTTMLVFVPHMWYFFSTTEKCILYHICGIFLIPQEGKKPPLDVPFPENMVSPDGGGTVGGCPVLLVVCESILLLYEHRLSFGR